MAGAQRTVFGRESAIDFSFCRPAHLVDEPLGRLHLEHVAELVGRVVEPFDAEREAHAPLGPELVDEEPMARALRVLEEQRRPAGLDRAVDDLRHLEVGVDLCGDADELALALEERNPVAEIAGRVIEISLRVA